MENQELHQKTAVPPAGDTEKRETAHRLGTIGWALFFIWVGLALLIQLQFGLGLLGVGLLALTMQAARAVSKLNMEVFWVVVGLLFVGGGFWDMFEPDISLIPILLIVAGLVLLLSLARSGRKA